MKVRDLELTICPSTGLSRCFLMPRYYSRMHRFLNPPSVVLIPRYSRKKKKGDASQRGMGLEGTG